MVAGVLDGAVKFRVFERDAGDVDFQIVHFPAVFAVFERERGGDGLPCKRAAVFGERVGGDGDFAVDIAAPCGLAADVKQMGFFWAVGVLGVDFGNDGVAR